MDFAFIWLAIGITGTWVGAELLVRGAARLALGLGVRPLVVGLTVVALGTSSPEAVVSFLAAAKGKAEIALGNVLGSNIANIGLILGILALMHPIPVQFSSIRADVVLLVATTALAALLGYLGGPGFTRLDGIVLVLVLVGYVVYYIRTGHERSSAEIDLAAETAQLPRVRSSLLQSLIGLAILLYGAERFLSAATLLAERFGVPPAVIGATVLAVGTSLPELAASIVAIRRGHHEIGVGNILGSNVMNLVFVLGGAALIAPTSVPMDATAARVFFPTMLVFTAALIAFLRFGRTVSRLEGALLLGAYVLFAVRVYRI